MADQEDEAIVPVPDPVVVVYCKGKNINLNVPNIL
jgi:hypothetical protein